MKPFLPIKKGTPAMILAPMEGVTDAPMRELMGLMGVFQFCVTEFFRISHSLPSLGVFSRIMPEIKNGAVTLSGLPVQLQLLGGDPEMLAQAAERAVIAGARAIDINFGCPAPTVNRHDGGASLLKHPDRIKAIIETIRKTLPSQIPLSAKLRLGWENPKDILVNAEQAALGGASWITIHARTKVQNYTPPVHWNMIGEVRKSLDIPVVANGDIFCLEDLERCQELTQCEHFMIGRGALFSLSELLNMARAIGIHEINPQNAELGRPNVFAVLQKFVTLCMSYQYQPHHIANRLKQWCAFGALQNKQPWVDLHRVVKRLVTPEEILNAIELSNA